ncbi:MAG: FtsX-like permease family protein, partial [Bacteroidota bacterium]
PGFLGGLLFVAVLVGLVSGLYPAFYLSSFQPVRVIKGRLRLRLGDRLFRKGLVLTQFVISLILVISTLTIWQQYRFMREADLGFQKDQIVVIPTKLYMGSDKLQEYRNKMCSRPGIESTTMMNEVLGVHHNIHEYFYRQGRDTVVVFYPSLLVDRDFVETFRLKMIAGRDFSHADQDDATRAVLVNREFVDQMGWCPNEAIGQSFSTYRGEERIKGVLENFHFVSMRDSIQPFVLDIANSLRAQYYYGRYIAVRISGRDEKTVRKSLSYLRHHWEQIVPNHPFDYFFLDSKIDKLYEREDQLTSLVAYFSCLALIIACLGLFALAAYTAEQRTKEIGIRKVLGASDILIARTMAREFVQLILLAFPLGWLVAGLFMSDWLKSFAEPVGLSPLIFLLASVVVMCIALMTVMLHAFRAANSNPVMALRDE